MNGSLFRALDKTREPWNGGIGRHTTSGKCCLVCFGEGIVLGAECALLDADGGFATGSVASSLSI